MQISLSVFGSDEVIGWVIDKLGLRVDADGVRGPRLPMGLEWIKVQTVSQTRRKQTLSILF